MQPLAILIVDDDAQIRLALARVLARDPRVETVSAAAPSEALTILEARPIDLVLSDDVMPELTGVQLLEVIRARWPDTRRVLFTGNPGTERVKVAMDRGDIHAALAKGGALQALKQELTVLIEDCLSARPGNEPTR